MLNDGVRGPVLSLRQLGSRSYMTITASGVPVWFEVFNTLFAIHSKIKVATQTLSCELAVHCQTYSSYSTSIVHVALHKSST